MSSCKTLVIVHGKSELIFCKGLASNYRLNIAIDSEENGEKCIQILSLEERLCSEHYVSEYSLHKKFDKLEYLSEKDIKMPNLKIFPIMDTDDSLRHFNSYVTKNMFSSSPFKGRVVPIFNMPNLDKVLIDSGFDVDKNNKVESYQNIISQYELNEIVEKIGKSKNTNLLKFLHHCASMIPNYQNKW